MNVNFPAPNRPTPKLPAHAMQTFGYRAPTRPAADYWRSATCEEVGCPAWTNGWRTVLPAGSDHVEVAKRSGRAYVLEDAGPGLVAFRFHAGQPCFKASEHRVRTQRPGIFLTHHGDWRWQGAVRRFDRPDQWADEFATHQDRLARRAGQ